MDINECASEPCQNDAACFDDIGFYICECIHGFSGSLCESKVLGHISQRIYGGEWISKILAIVEC